MARSPAPALLALVVLSHVLLVAPFTLHRTYWPLHAGCALLLLTLRGGLGRRTASLRRALCLLVAACLISTGVLRVVAEKSRATALAAELWRLREGRALLRPRDINDVSELIRKPTLEELCAVARHRGAGWGRASVDALEMLRDPGATAYREGGEVLFVCGFSAPRWLPLDPAWTEWLHSEMRDEQRRTELAEAARARLMDRLAQAEPRR